MTWESFDKFNEIVSEYMPEYGEGETLASQTVTAVNKLIYKWYNDGDVYDNTYFMNGWANDLSSYANWLSKYVDAGSILDDIQNCLFDDDYEEILWKLAEKYLNREYLGRLSNKQKQGTIYKCVGKYEWNNNETWEGDEM